ncbi:MAG: hypothetical protein ABI697_02390 [Devosia sp.]
MIRHLRLGLMLTAALAAGALSGCAYDYLNHSDRLGYSAGDAVKANLESETINPGGAKTNTGGLGQNGIVIPPGSYTAPASP